MNLLEKIHSHALAQPGKTALTGSYATLDYHALVNEVERFSTWLDNSQVQVVGLYADNTPAWVIADLASLNCGICLVPLPQFFSPAQLMHAIQQAGINAIITDSPEPLQTSIPAELTLEDETLEVAGSLLSILRTPLKPRQLPKGIVKITYTSGTTGEPKGVMLGWNQIQPVISSLSEAVLADSNDTHLALMPLAVLLENLAGVYVSLWTGANVVLPGLAATGLAGATGLDIQKTMSAIINCSPSTLIMTPQVLQASIEYLEKAPKRLESLRFIALGGAPVSQFLLDKAEQLKLPVYEGYGLSECASVTTLNTPDAHKKGSVGRALPHIDLAISESGEVLIQNCGFSGYLDQPRDATDNTWYSGDLGYLDDDGYLYLTGRKRNVFITAMGRNVAPEWIERELVLAPEIIQVAVFGEARDRNIAVIVPVPGCDETTLWQAIETVNASLPDYARISHFITASEAFTPLNRQLSGTGRNRRQVIYQAYENQIENYYQHLL